MSSVEEGKQVVQPEATRPPSPRPSSTASSLSSNDDAKTVTEGAPEKDSDNVSISSSTSYPDVIGRRGLALAEDEASKTVYEAWEITYSDDTTDWDSWHVFCGLRFNIKWKSLNDGFIDISPVTCYEQEALADLHEDRMLAYEDEAKAKGRWRGKGKSYDQDMANRVFDLDPDIYKRLQHLVDDRTKATNKTPYHRREWRVVVFDEGEFQMTDALPERRKSLFRRRRPKPQVQRWLVVLRGEEVRSTKDKDGWRLFSRLSNPWWRIDNEQTRPGRLEHREHLKKVQQHNQRKILAARQGQVPQPMMGPPMGHPMGPPMRPPMGVRPVAPLPPALRG
ncbi:hypothetical protein GGR52DRAFT_568836 [Hypoxylon sp. FL1284]|nr:hypothetical protein GGR52DRAFT_568836 [Hypoxylon sp. FL1284]